MHFLLQILFMLKLIDHILHFLIIRTILHEPRHSPPLHTIALHIVSLWQPEIRTEIPTYLAQSLIGQFLHLDSVSCDDLLVILLLCRVSILAR